MALVEKSHQVKTAFVLQTHMLTAESEEFKLWENSPHFCTSSLQMCSSFENSVISLSALNNIQLFECSIVYPFTY